MEENRNKTSRIIFFISTTIIITILGFVAYHYTRDSPVNIDSDILKSNPVNQSKQTESNNGLNNLTNSLPDRIMPYRAHAIYDGKDTKKAQALFLMARLGTDQKVIESAVARAGGELLAYFPDIIYGASITGYEYPNPVDIYQIDFPYSVTDAFAADGFFGKVKIIESPTSIIKVFWKSPFSKESSMTINKSSLSYPSIFLFTANDYKQRQLLLYDNANKSIKKIYSGLSNRIKYIQIEGKDKILIFDDKNKQILQAQLPLGEVKPILDLSRYGGEWSFSVPVFSPKRDKIAFTVQNNGYYLSGSKNKDRIIAGNDNNSVLIILDIGTLKIEKEFPIKFNMFVNVWTLNNKIYLGTAAPKDCALYPYSKFYNVEYGKLFDTTEFTRELQYQISQNGEYAAIIDVHPDNLWEDDMCGTSVLGVIRLQTTDGKTIEVEKLTSPQVLSFVGWLADSQGFVYKKDIRKIVNGVVKQEITPISSKFILYDVGANKKTSYATLSEIEQDGYDLGIPSGKLNLLKKTTGDWKLEDGVLDYFVTTSLYANGTSVDSSEKSGVFGVHYEPLIVVGQNDFVKNWRRWCKEVDFTQCKI